MSKIGRLVVHASGTTQGDLDALIAMREDTAKGRAAVLRAGVNPPDIAEAPIMDDWSLVPNPHGPLFVSVTGFCPWHPDTRRPHPRTTSPVHVLDVERGYFLTEGGWYRLGRPAPATVVDLEDPQAFEPEGDGADEGFQP